MQPQYLSDRLYFDIETTEHPKAGVYLGLKPLTVDDLKVADLKQVLANKEISGTGTKPELVERAQSEAGFAVQQLLEKRAHERDEEALEKAPLDPDLGQIKAIGWASGNGILEVWIAEPDDKVAMDARLPEILRIDDDRSCAIQSYYISGDDAERDMIAGFWGVAEEHRLNLVGANILNFDLPFLLRRSMDLEIPVPIKLNLRRYQVEPICDTMQILSHWGAFRYKSLKFMCNRYGITIPMPDVDGSMVKDMDNSTLARYVASDVWITRELWKKMDGVYWPKIVDVQNPDHGR